MWASVIIEAYPVTDGSGCVLDAVETLPVRKGQTEVTRLAERMICHQMSDAEILYPAAVLIGSTVHVRTTEVVPVE